MSTFILNSTLANDSILAGEDDDHMLRLMNDERFPWALLIPKVAGARELHDLDDKLLPKTVEVAANIGRAMHAAFEADKINTAALGNMVAQLHIHIIARRQDDPAWPKPVWGVGELVPMSDGVRRERLDVLSNVI